VQTIKIFYDEKDKIIEIERIQDIAKHRHDVTGVTASEVYDAHQKDLKIQDSYECKMMGFWCDVEKGSITSGKL